MILEEDKQRQTNESIKATEESKVEWNQRLEKATRLAESRQKELEAMVVKYAMSENQIFAAKTKRDEFEKKCKDALKDKDSLMMRIKGLSNEKLLLVSQLEQKSGDLSNNAKEIDKLRMQIKERDAQLIQSTFALQQEQSAHRDCRQASEESERARQELRREVEQRKEQAEVEVKTNEAINRLEAQLQQERNAFQSKVAQLESENGSFLTKIQKLEREQFGYEEQQEQARQTVGRLQTELKALQHCQQQLHEASRDLTTLQDQLSEGEALRDTLKAENSELQKEMDSCRQKEGELLEFVERLQSKTVQLQSEHILLEQKNSKESSESIELKDQTRQLQERVKMLEDSLQSALNEATESKREAERLKEALDKETDAQRRTKDELENELRVFRKRNAQNVKELNKELQSLRRKLEMSEADSSSQADASSTCSRANSISSLEKSVAPVAVAENGISGGAQLIGAEGDLVIPVDKQKLIHKIVSLQKSMVKKRERIEFLEEHNNQLTEEMKKKTRIIQNYILREEAGALTTNDMDTYKVRALFLFRFKCNQF
jgi:hypothetical protein